MCFYRDEDTMEISTLKCLKYYLEEMSYWSQTIERNERSDLIPAYDNLTRVVNGPDLPKN